MESHTALFVALTKIGKMHLALDLLELEYLNYFDYVIILCPTLKHNEMYRQGKLFWTNSYVIPIEPGNHLYD